MTLSVAAPVFAAGDVDTLLHNRLGNPRLGSDTAMLVIDAQSGEVVSEESSDARQLPASTMKIITAISVLASLGEEHRFTTRIRQGSSNDTGTEIILEGGGDPLLSRADLQELAKESAQAISAAHDATGLPGKPRVVLRADTRLFPDTGRARGWPSGYVPSVASTVQALALVGDYSTNPSKNAVDAFASYLRTQGIRVSRGEPVVDESTQELPVLAEVSDNTSADAVRRMLSISDNNVAEVLHRHVALARGITADWDGATKATEDVLRELGLDPSDQAIMDGSGLSRKDRITPRFLVDALRLARVTNPGPFTMMFEDDAMPVAGRTGTLDDAYGRFVTKKSKCAVGQARAKTGTLFDTIALSGLATTVDGRERIFAFLVNDRPQQYSALSTRQALDGLVATVTECWG